MATVDEEIKTLTYYNFRPLLLRGYVGPFLVLYILWLYVFVYGTKDYFDAGVIAVGIILFIHVLTRLFCVWSVHVQCALTCSVVSLIQFFTLSGKKTSVFLKEKSLSKAILWFIVVFFNSFIHQLAGYSKRFSSHFHFKTRNKHMAFPFSPVK